MQSPVLVGSHGANIPHHLHSSSLTVSSGFFSRPVGTGEGHGNGALFSTILKARDLGSLLRPLGWGSMSVFLCLSSGGGGSQQRVYRPANGLPSPLPNALGIVCLRPASEQLRCDVKLID